MIIIETITSDSKDGYCLQGIVIALDNDDVIVIVSGGRDHIGALSLAIPHPSLQDQCRMSVTSSILTVPGHKDDELAKYVSEKVSAVTERKIVVIAGVHYDDLALADLSIIRELWISLTEKIIFFINGMIKTMPAPGC